MTKIYLLPFFFTLIVDSIACMKTWERRREAESNKLAFAHKNTFSHKNAYLEVMLIMPALVKVYTARAEIVDDILYV